MVRLFYTLVAAISLYGCASKPEIRYEYVIKEVMIPVIAEPPEPPNVTLPYLPIFNISQEDLDQENYEKIAKAYKVSIVELQKHIKELHTILDGYRQ